MPDCRKRSQDSSPKTSFVPSSVSTDSTACGPAAAVSEAKERVRVLRERPARGQQEEAARHPQVRDEHAAVVQLREDVFAAPPDLLKSRAAKRARDIARRVLGGEPRAEECRRLDAEAGDEAVERARDEFHFG